MNNRCNRSSRIFPKVHFHSSNFETSSGTILELCIKRVLAMACTWPQYGMMSQYKLFDQNMHDKWLLVRHAREVRGQSVTALSNDISTNQMAFLLQVYNSLHKCKELSPLHKLHMHSLNVVSQTSDLPSKYVIQDALPMGPLS